MSAATMIEPAATATLRPAPLRVTFLSVSSEMGGAEVSLLELVRGLRRLAAPWTLDVIVPRDGPLPRAVRAAGARTHILPLPQRFSRVGEMSGGGAVQLIGRGASLLLATGSLSAYSRRLAKLLRDLAPDVIHSNGFKMHVLGARVARRPSALVWHLHEYVAPRAISRRLLRRYVPRCAAVVANSRSVAAEVQDALALRVPVTTIYNAVDAQEFSPEGETLDLDRLAGLPPAGAGTVRVGLVATYGRWKGQATFIDAIGRLAPASPIRAYIIGGALYDTRDSQHTREELARSIDSAGLAGRIGLTGFIERPAAALRALDVVVHASTRPEPFGLVIAEGLAAGRAVIVSAAGGAGEIVSDGVDALTHAPGDAAGLARCIARLAGDAALRQRLGAAGRASALRQFDPDHFTRAFMNVYHQARAAAASDVRD